MSTPLGARLDRIRSNFFLVPFACIVGGALLAQVSLLVDREVGAQPDLPLGLTSTVDSARAVLGTVAGATITVAGIAFSVSLLIIQLASSQYSPRVVHGLFRDPFNKRVMGLVVGTFTYCLVVLRSVRSSLEEGGDPVIPNLSVAAAVVLGIASVLAIVAFIDHSAHSMDVSQILDVVTREGTAVAKRTWTDEAAAGDVTMPPGPSGPSSVVTFDCDGWIDWIDVAALAAAAPPSSFVRVETTVGRYAVAGTPLCRVWPPLDPASADRTIGDARRAVHVARTRTASQDVGYALRQLADVALRALSPGVNDPTTAQDAIFHSATVLRELQRRTPPPPVRTGPDAQVLLLGEEPTPSELVELAYGEVRRAAASQPVVCIYLLEALHLLDATGPSGAEWQAALRDQAAAVVRGAGAAGILPSDLRAVTDAYEKRFGPAGTGGAATA